MLNSGTLLTCVRPIAVVQSDNKIHEQKNTTASQPVNFFKTSAVDVPNNESLDSPPNDAPSPVLLLSWIKITKHKTAQTHKNKVMAKKYRTVIALIPLDN